MFSHYQRVHARSTNKSAPRAQSSSIAEQSSGLDENENEHEDEGEDDSDLEPSAANIFEAPSPSEMRSPGRDLDLISSSQKLRDELAAMSQEFDSQMETMKREYMAKSETWKRAIDVLEKHA